MQLIKIGISGCLGRMGKELVVQTKNKSRISFVGGFDLKDKKTFQNRNGVRKRTTTISYNTGRSI